MNEIIEIMPHIITIFIGNIFYNFCFAQINKKHLKWNKRNIIIIFLSSVLILCNNTYDNMFLKSIANLLIMCVNYKLIFKESIKRTIVSYIIIYVIMMLFELLYSNIILTIDLFKISANYLTYTKIFLSIITSISGYLLLKIKVLRKFIDKLIKDILSLTTLMNIFYLLLLVIIIIGIFNVYNYEEKGSYKIILLIVVLFAILFILNIKSKTKEEVLKLSNSKLIEYNEKYGQFLDEYKIYKHNIKHKLAGMKTFGNKKINALIDDLLEEEDSFTIKNNNIYNVPNGIKGIVAERLYNTKINVLIDNKLDGDPFTKLNAKEFNNISEAIGICLDNAVEACLETENPTIILDIYEDQEYLYIKIGNNFCNDIDIDELGDKYYSTKNRGSGLGLFSIMQNKLIKEKISIINGFYYIELKIKKHA